MVDLLVVSQSHSKRIGNGVVIKEILEETVVSSSGKTQRNMSIGMERQGNGRVRDEKFAKILKEHVQHGSYGDLRLHRSRIEAISSKMGDIDINTLTMKRELREDTFLGNKNDDAYEHIENVLDIISKKENEGSLGVLPCQLPLKEMNPRSFILPCTIVKMADISKKAPMGIVEIVLVKIDRPFLATIHARINIFHKEISLGIGQDRILFDMNGNVHHLAIPIERVCMTNTIQEEESFNPLEIAKDLFSYDSPLCLEFEIYN
uniref:Reverse transcriptase domain-containing protein n=1 Tax=Tanacetum cinerariifolium TaxID=118510 RepID=A0A699I8C0_TANCI|nr:hypothetical protein [Tanacetum cinerariifolium]